MASSWLSSDDPLTLPMHVQADWLRRGRLSALELTRAQLARARQLSSLGAWLCLDEERALAQAAQADASLARGKGQPLSGLLLAVKDNLCLTPLPMTCASRLLQGYLPPQDATAVARARDAGAILAGKTNLDEFGMGSTNEHSAYGPARNPWDLQRSPGGSSGGTAAAVTAGLASAGLGSDTGGSVRLPAAWTGLTGLRPTYGRISRSGLTAYASSLDTVGILGRDVRDVAMLFDLVAGHDPADATSLTSPASSTVGGLETDIRGLRLGLAVEQLPGPTEVANLSRLEEAIAVFSRLGVHIRPVSVPSLRKGLAAYYVLASAEASSNLARFDGLRYGQRVPGPDLEETVSRSRSLGLGPEVIRRILLGTFVLSDGYVEAWYDRARAVRAQLQAELAAVFQEVDLLISPVAPGPALPLGLGMSPMDLYRTDVYTVGASLAGLPALALPAGFSLEGLPMGLQLVAPPEQEARLLQAGRAFERETLWSGFRPPRDCLNRDAAQLFENKSKSSDVVLGDLRAELPALIQAWGETLAG